MAKIELLYRVLVHDKTGKVVKRTRWRKSKSFVLQFMMFVERNLHGNILATLDTGNVSRTVPSTASAGWTFHAVTCNSGDNDDNFGIVIGTGVTPPENDDYALETQIAHGTGAGQLDYGAHNWTATAIVGANVDLVVSRSFYNGSGSTVTVNEIGIYVKSYSAATPYYFCVVRDVLAAGVDVLDTQTLTVQYTLRTTV